MQGGVTYNGSTLLSGSIDVNASGNIEPLTLTYNENGNYVVNAPEGVDGYDPVTINVNVPQVEPVLDTLNVSSNGTYTPPSGVDGYDEVNVSVPTPEPVLDTLNVSSNGTYTPPSGVDGYDEVNVNVPTPEPVLDTLNVTSNGTYTPASGVDGYDEVNVSISGYTIKKPSTTPTSIALFTDGTANPLKSLTVSIEPVQAGSGDPSPTNVRPISGWSGVNTTVCGKNYLNTIQDNVVLINGGEAPPVISNQSITYNIPEGAYFFLLKAFKIERCHVGKTYVMSYNITPNNTGYTKFVICNTDGSGRQEKALTATITEADVGKLLTVRFYPNAEGNYTITNIQVEEGSTPTTYEAYNGTTTTINFVDGQGQSVTVYGGEIDVINGVVTPCPYYASYNGEQLTGEWISDRDVYSPNTTPTTGAQVVNIGATGTPLSVHPTSIKSLDGENNVFASTGQIEELEYFADL